MQLYVLDKNFEKEDIIENYQSLIWTERYLGDSDVEIVFPLSLAVEVAQKLPLNAFLSLDESPEPMIVETVYIENQQVKVQGISVLSWLNNRFVRTSKNHKTRTWELEGLKPGEVLWSMVSAMCDPDSTYLTTENTDIPQIYLDRLKLPEIGLHSYDASGDNVVVAIPFAPLYDEMKKIATTYHVGIQIVLERIFNPEAERPLGFRSYKGLNRTRAQDPDAPQNAIVQFSSALNSLANVKELRSQAPYKTLAFVFGPNLTPELGDEGDNNAGVAYPDDMSDPGVSSGFNCRAIQVFAEDLRGYSATPSPEVVAKLVTILSNAGKDVLARSILVNAVDGDVVETGQFQYGRDYGLGDEVEIVGSDGSMSSVMVTEHVLSHDSSGERKYGLFSRNSSDVNV